MDIGSPHSVSTIGLRAVLVALASTRGHVSEILSAAGIERSLVDNPEGRIGLDALGRFFREASIDLRDPLVGLHMAALIPFGTHQMSDYILSSSPSLGEGILRFIKYFPILHQELSWELRTEGNRALLELKLSDERLYDRQIIEYEVSLLISRLKAATQKDVDVVDVQFKHEAAADAELYIKGLETTVHFKKAQNLIMFSSECLLMGCIESSSHLSDLLLRSAEEKLLTLPLEQARIDPIVEKCDRFLREHLKDGLATIEELSKFLGMSPRTLQRKLSDLGVSFSDILQETRFQVSQNLLTDDSLSLAEVSFLTGFSESSAFHRAFKKWTGVTPLQWRKDN